MANIDLTALHTKMKRVFRTQGQGAENFTQSFVDAVNQSTSEINTRCDLEDRISKINSPEDEVALSDEYLHVLDAMVSVTLIDDGQRPSRGQEETYEILRRRIPRLVDQIATDIQNQAQEDDTNDTSNFVGLGGLG